jgi:hypothetical protein
MAAPFLLRGIHSTIESLYDQQFQQLPSSPEEFLFKSLFHIRVEGKGDPLTADCILAILRSASEMAYPHDHMQTCQIDWRSGKSPVLIITKSDYNSIEGRISSVFLHKLSDFSHVYLHYLRQGWNSVPYNDGLFRKAPDGDESLYLEKKMFSDIGDDEEPLLLLLAEKAGCEIFQTYSVQYGYTESDHRIGLHVTEKNLFRLLEFIKAEAEDVRVKVPLHIVRTCQIEGAGPLQKFLRDKSLEFLKKSRSFLKD